MPTRLRSVRGAAIILLVVVLFTAGASAVLTDKALRYYEGEKERRRQQSQSAAQAAKEALSAYMLLRVDNPLKIAQGSAGSVNSRLLMLPCPDNVGDANLDGSQDPHCGAETNSSVNVVNNILDSGSRFGRLPWHSRVAAVDTINEGLGVDFRDGGNNRLWYALSRNMAPTFGDNNVPLNFHRLATQEEGWLRLVNQRGEIINDKIAAVILAPHVGRVSEAILQTGTYRYSPDVNQADGLLAPTRYFESVTISATGGRAVLSNADRDGVFIRAPESAAFNDVVAYLGVDELIAPNGVFFRGYEKIVGVSPLQNQAVANSPLANSAAALRAYHNLFQFYPPPANLTAAAHLNERKRHCAAYHSGDRALPVTVGAAMTLLTPAALTVQGASSSLALNGGDFLLAENATVAAAATVTRADQVQTVSVLVLARYARLSVVRGAATAAAGVLQTLSGGVLVPAGATVVLQPSALVVVRARTPLRPPGNLLGWLPEHDSGTLIHAGADNAKFLLATDTRAAFFSGAELLVSLTATVFVGGDAGVLLTAGSEVEFEEDFAGLEPLRGVIHSVTVATTLAQVTPTPDTYKRRQFAVWLLADAPSRRGARTTISAPAVLFPWRQKTSDTALANTRDNLHPYPPCFDSRNFYDRKFRRFLEDQPMVYAVADACHYGGDNAACGKTAGLTVSVAVAATVALPQTTTLTLSFTLSLSRTSSLRLRDGVVQNAANITLSPTLFPMLSVDGGIATTAAFFLLSTALVLTSGATVVFPAATPLVGGDGVIFRHVPALLMYSPAPLPRTRCASGMSSTMHYNANGARVTLADQTAAAADITALCYWLEDEENADGDALYVIRPPVRAAVVSTTNDFFLLLGGEMHIP